MNTVIVLTQSWEGSHKRLVSIKDNEVTLISSGTRFGFNSFFKVNKAFKTIGENIDAEEALTIINEKKVDYENYRAKSTTSKEFVSDAEKEIEFLTNKYSLSLIA
nr:hypothetical protein [Vibrio splendidus]MCC4880855.1 hypothetical protein [Vibrio splendidus]